MKIYVCQRNRDLFFLQKEFPEDEIVEHYEEAELILFFSFFEKAVLEYIQRKNKESYMVTNIYLTESEIKPGLVKKRVEDFIHKVRERSRGFEL